jgi:hypothetical protein
VKKGQVQVGRRGGGEGRKKEIRSGGRRRWEEIHVRIYALVVTTLTNVVTLSRKSSSSSSS